MNEMNDKLYVKIKLLLLKYDQFEQLPSSFTDLFQYSKQYKHGKPFKQFVKICKNMGVVSRVVRTDSGLVRVLTYDKSKDKYAKGEVMTVGACEHCKGTGIVQKPIEINL
jgi:hypothetical protein